MPHKYTTLALALSAMLLAQGASAEVYISPVMKNSVSSGMPSAVTIIAETPKDKQDWSPDQAKPTVSTHVIEKPVVVSDAVQVNAAQKKPILSSGKHVPIDIALKNILGSRDRWHIEHDGTSSMNVSWKDAQSTEDAISQIQRKSGISISVNDEHKRIGVSTSASVADKLAVPGNRVWHLVAGKDLRENLSEWGKQAGWKVDFSQTMMNYPVDHDAKLVGYFSGEGGVVDDVLSATSGRENPLRGRFYRANNVVVVLEAGFKAEENKMPTVGNK